MICVIGYRDVEFHALGLTRKEAARRFEECLLAVKRLWTEEFVDMTGAHLFLGLHKELQKRGILFRLVEARSKVRDMLRLEGVEDKIGRIDRFTTLAQAIDGLRAESVTARTTLV